MENSKKLNGWQIVLLLLNVLGIICLAYLSINYFKFDMEITNPDSMIPMSLTEASGMSLLIGFVPLLIVNILGFICMKGTIKKASLLFFVPSVICVAVIAHYLFIGPAALLGDYGEPDVFTITIKIDDELKEPIYGIECEYGIGEENLGSLAATSADYSTYDEKVVIGFSKQMLKDATDYSDFYINVTVYKTEEEARSSVATLQTQNEYPEVSLTLDMHEGDSLTYVLTKDGNYYSLDIE